ncbi:MAG: pitrilysin family protein [Spirochaetes bacterium]|jgi:predicted Zn-dependent peptidase|nr:pitrilysin family protein [Spirochaetota bacterium]
MNRYVLPSGLVVILQPIEHAVSTSVGLWIKAGSRDEGPEQYGYAHFVEHMLFKGTPRYNAKELAQLVDRIGGQHNAATNKEYTCYYLNVVSDYCRVALEVLSDMFYNPLFSEEEIEKEKGVVIEEIGMYEDTPDEHIHDLFTEMMFNDHPLAHLILGSTETVSAINRESVVSFYDTHYGSSNSVLVVAGKFDMNEMQIAIAELFSEERKYQSSIEAVKPAIPAVSRIYHQHVERELEQVHFCLGVDGHKKRSDDRWILYLVSTILGGSMSSRLFQRVREDEGLCYSVYSFHSSYRDTGLFGIYCGTSPEKYERALQLILDELNIIVNNGISIKELEDAKRYIKGNLALSLESIEVRMGQLARDEIHYGSFYSFDEIIENIFAVTPNDFDRVVRDIFCDKRLSLVSIGNNVKYDDRPLYVGR